MNQEEKDTTRSPFLAGIAAQDDDEVSKEELEELLRKVDKESATRRLFGMPRWIVYWIGVAFSSFQVYTAAFGLLPAQLQRSVHLAFVFVLIYLLFPFRSSKDSDRLRWYDYLLAAFAGFVGLYVLLNYTRIMEAGGDFLPVDFVFAGFGILLTLEAARRAVGMPIVSSPALFLVYAYLGALFPRLPGSSRLLAAADRLPHVLHHRRHHGHPPGGVGEFHLLVHPVRGFQ